MLHLARLSHRSVRWCASFAAACLGAVLLLASAQEARPVALLQIDGPIGPATADYVVRGLAKAKDQSAQLVVLQMDTPGGLDTSMRQIIKAVLSSPVPVAAFVAPDGARAASAGTYLMYASHVAAMAPATNLGAATPVPVGMPGGQPEDERPRREPAGGQGSEKPADKGKGDGKSEPASEPATEPVLVPGASEAMRNKAVNDAVAYIRSLAELRGRNAEWAERAVRGGVSLSAQQALQQKVIDLVVADVPALLRALDGRRLEVQGRTVVLATRDAAVVPIEPDARTRFLSVITHPSVALVLMLIGMYGLFFEFSSPGVGVPGVIGAICLLLALYALQLLPVNYAGLGLILLGLALMAAEVFVPSFGILGFGGVVAFVLGATLLLDTEVPGFGVPLWLIGGLAAGSALLIVGVGGMVLRSRRAQPASGHSVLIGQTGHVIDAEGGWAEVCGERWRVRSGQPLAPGARVRVTSVDGLALGVEPEPPPARQP